MLTFQVSVAFESSFGCPIERIQMAVDRVERAGGAIREVEESWSVRGCGQRENYRVVTRPSARGGVDISVMVRE